MSNSKNNSSMINLLFLLVLAFPQVSAGVIQSTIDLWHNRPPPKQPIERECNAKSSECCWVVNSYKKMAGVTKVDAHDANPMACCDDGQGFKWSWRAFGWYRTGIEGVFCKDKKMTISWSYSFLYHQIPADLGHVTSLESL